jgi:Flp pilus assembly protein TadG
MRRFLEKRRLFYKDCSGAITVEFALIATSAMVLMPLIWDLALVTSSSMALSGSMRAGIQYAMSRPSDNTGIGQVIESASGFAVGSVTVTTNQSCECAGLIATCGTTCSGGGTPAMYDTITASYQVPTMLPYAGYPTNHFPISNTVTVRVQ